MSENNIVITGVGMVSSIGNDWEQSCAAHRAGINQFLEYEDFYPENEEMVTDELQPLIAARSSSIGVQMEELRAPKLMVPALQDLISNSNIPREMFDSTIFLTAVSPGESAKHEKRLLSAYKQELLKLSVNCSAKRKLIKTNHTGFIELVSAASMLLASGECQACILLAVDSLNSFETLEALDGKERIKSKKSPSGLIPGESAVAVIVETQAHALAREAEIMATVSATAKTTEQNILSSDRPSSGLGLSTAIRQVCEQANEFRPSWVVCDLNGETYRAYEWGMTQVKANDVLSNMSVLWHPADCFGDVGAATGGLLTALVVKAFEKQYAPANDCLIWCSDDNGKRATLVISAFN